VSHKVSRDYHEPLRRLGIQNPSEVRVADPVFTIPLDRSVAELVPPFPVPVFGCTASVSGVAGNHSGIAITAGGRGIWLLEFREFAGAGALFYTGVAPDTVVATLAPGFLPSGAIESTVQSIRQLAANLPPSPFRIDPAANIMSGIAFPLSGRVWIPRGVVVTAVNNAANTVGSYSALFSEVPRRGANPDED
jgi:hypothetical protein